jgi:uncharacterized DUF497 family protein
MLWGNIEFAWDRRKARSNLIKHGISFEEAQTVFWGDDARLIDDPDNSVDERRFVLLAYSSQARCLIVSHCYRESNTLIRLISARRATAQKRKCIGGSDEKRIQFFEVPQEPVHQTTETPGHHSSRYDGG